MREIKLKCPVYEDNDSTNFIGFIGVWDSALNTGLYAGDESETLLGCGVFPDELPKHGIGKAIQFTGLIDANGKEVWEGDIVKFLFLESNETSIQYVEWRDDMYCFLLMPFEHELYHTQYLEVIGNVYENPDLIDRGTQ